MIFGPDGKALCEPVGVGEEAILKADIDLRDIDYAKTVRFRNLCSGAESDKYFH
jgi:hypothetical protein